MLLPQGKSLVSLHLVEILLMPADLFSALGPIILSTLILGLLDFRTHATHVCDVHHADLWPEQVNLEGLLPVSDQLRERETKLNQDLCNTPLSKFSWTARGEGTTHGGRREERPPK